MLMYKPTAISANGNLNVCFEVSPEFELEFEVQMGISIDSSGIEFRTHPFAVNLFIRKGAEWAGAGLDIMALPDELRNYWSVLEFRNGERIYFHYDRLMADILAKYMITKNSVWLENSVRKATELMAAYPNTVKPCFGDSQVYYIDARYTDDYKNDVNSREISLLHIPY